jgi:nucleoside-diphosphate-sugar epimerase
MSDEWFLKKLVHAIVFGEELETSALTQVWNLLHVTDLSSAILTLLKSQSSGIFNIASEKSFSFLEIVNQISNIAKTESRLKVGSLPFRRDETFVMRPSIEKLRSLGWSETVSLNQGLREMIAQVQLSN